MKRGEWITMEKTNYDVIYIDKLNDFFQYAQKGYFGLVMPPFLKSQALHIFQTRDYFKENELLWFIQLLLESKDEKNVKIGKKLIQEFLKDANPVAGTIYGEYYYSNNNISLAFGYFLLAAMKKNAKAEYYMGRIYLEGEHMLPNKRKAFYWLKRSASQDYAEAYYALAEEYFLRNKPNYALVKKYARLAHQLHFYPATRLLGQLYLEGKGYKKNEEKAFSLFLLAARYNEPKALYYLGYCYKYGLGVSKDEIAMLYWYKKAAEMQEIHAIYELGLYYLLGKGTFISYAKAYGYFSYGKELGSKACTLEFARLYEEGKGVKKDEEKALQLYLSLIKDEYLPAYYEVGRCYYFGIGAEKDLKKAFFFLVRAKREGMKEAEKIYRHYYLTNKGKEKEEKPSNFEKPIVIEKSQIPFTPIKMKNYSVRLSTKQEKRIEKMK